MSHIEANKAHHAPLFRDLHGKGSERRGALTPAGANEAQSRAIAYNAQGQAG
jgi:hypothetical protein